MKQKTMYFECILPLGVDIKESGINQPFMSVVGTQNFIEFRYTSGGENSKVLGARCVWTITNDEPQKVVYAKFHESWIAVYGAHETYRFTMLSYRFFEFPPCVTFTMGCDAQTDIMEVKVGKEGKPMIFNLSFFDTENMAVELVTLRAACPELWDIPFDTTDEEEMARVQTKVISVLQKVGALTV